VVADPAAVPNAVAAVLGITQQPGKTVAQSVAAALEGRVRLLVFDNCEHLVDSVADLIEAILAASATVTILATSREGLGVSEEQLWRSGDTRVPTTRSWPPSYGRRTRHRSDGPMSYMVISPMQAQSRCSRT
jgi:hypothetical protein